MKSFDDIALNPIALYGKNKSEVAEILGSGWTEGVYGSAGGGWKYTNGDKSVFYHPGEGVHGGSYYGYSSAALGKVKIVDPATYVPTVGDRATIIYLP